MATLLIDRRRLRAAAFVVSLCVLVQALLTGCSSPLFGGSDGRSVRGGKDANSAKSLGLGDWVDELGAAETDTGRRVYTVERGEANAGISVAASIDGQPGVATGVEVKLTRDAEQCDTDRRESSETEPSLVLTALVENSARSDSSAECTQADRLTVTVTRTQGTDERPVRLRVTRLPVVASESEWQSVERPTNPPTLNLASPEQIDAGTWLNSAPRLKPQQSVSGTIGANDRATFALRVAWGQRLAWKVVFPEAAASVQQQITERKITAHVRIFNPQGGSTSAQDAWNLGKGAEVTGYHDEVTMYASTDRNNMQGRYVVMVQTVGADGADVDIPYQLVLDVMAYPDERLGPDMSVDGPKGAVSDRQRLVIGYGLIALGGVLMAVGGLIIYASKRRRY